jgi:hypothetical protein
VSLVCWSGKTSGETSGESSDSAVVGERRQGEIGKEERWTVGTNLGFERPSMHGQGQVYPTFARLLNGEFVSDSKEMRAVHRYTKQNNCILTNGKTSVTGASLGLTFLLCERLGIK